MNDFLKLAEDLDWGYNVSDTYTAIPVITLTLRTCNRVKKEVLAADYPWMDFESLARIVSELNDELEG